MKVLMREEAPNVLRAMVKRLKRQVKNGYRVPPCPVAVNTGLYSYLKPEPLLRICGEASTHMGLNGPRCAACIKKEYHGIPIF